MPRVFYRTHAIRFACTGCGRCCAWPGDDYIVEVSRAEQRRIQEFLGVSWAWFRRRYVTRHDDDTDSLRIPESRCVFLDAANRCRIYPVRPLQCRTYPFWPELLGQEKRWRAERRHCEGIDRGEVVPLARIQRLLKTQHRADAE